MNDDQKPVTELGDLISALYANDSTQKYSASLHVCEARCTVTEYFDSGAGSSSAFSSSMREVEMSVFLEAKKKGYIVGKPMLGYTSTTEFILVLFPEPREQALKIMHAWREKDWYTQRSAYEVEQGRPGTYIKIVKIPDGEAPEEIRQAWVGLVLPAHHVVGYGKWKERERGALSKEFNARNRYGYSVLQKEALDVLEKKHPEAAKWWRAQGFPLSEAGMDHFSFGQFEVEEIAGTFTHQKIVHITEEMQGNPDR